MSKIFVVIPSFQEEDLCNTVNSIFENAEHPERIYVGICNQRTDNKDFETFEEYGDRVRCVDVRSPRPLGLGFAYFSASKLLMDEEFFMRIDAHTRMKKNWDSTLINYFRKIEEQRGHSKIIITQLTGGFYKQDMNLPGFIKHEDKDEWFHEGLPPNINGFMNDLIRQLKEYALNIEHHPNNNYEWDDISLANGFKEIYGVAGAFHFGKSQFLTDCSPDPRVFFWGEEHTFAMRAWTRGYRLYAIDVNTQFTAGKTEEYLETVGIDDWRNFWKSYRGFTVRYESGSVSPSFPTHSDPDSPVIKILSGKELGFYGAKDEQSYADYMQKLGIGWMF